MTRARRKSKRRRRLTTPEERAVLLAAFERSGDSAAAFAREHGIAYSTFCSWRHQQPTANDPSPGFVEVALDASPAPVGLLVEVGSQMRLHVSAPDQVEWAVQLIRTLEESSAALNSLRQLAQALERNPSSLLTGKKVSNP